MPNQDDPTQNQNLNQQNSQPVDASTPSSNPPTIFPQADLPPLPPEFQNLSTPPSDQPAANDSGSGAPPEIPLPTSQPKKKFGGGKIIATILGLVVLVGGVGAGILLTQQPQLFQQKAGGNCTCFNQDTRANENGSCNSNGTCTCSSAASHPTSNNCVASNSAQETAPANSASNENIRTAPGASENIGGNTAQETVTTAPPSNSAQETVTKAPCSQIGSACTTSSTCCSNKCTSGQCVVASNSAQETTITKASCTDSTQCGIGTVCTNGQCVTENKASENITGGSCSQVSCTANGCSVGSMFNANTCVVYHYWCQDIDHSGCGQYNGVFLEAGASASFSKSCGTEQIDLYCPVCYNNDTSKQYNDFKSNFHGEIACGATSSNPPSGQPSAPQCLAVNAYDTSWNPMAQSQLTALGAGSSVNFCVNGSAPSGTFDKARFTINSVLQAETTTVRPGSTDFCQTYVIPAGTTTVNVSGEIHHAVQGWF